MESAPLPPDEEQRLDSLAALGLLDSPQEERFDRLTRLACQLFDVPMAAVSLVDRDRQWFKSRQGLEACQTDRGVAFCAHAILVDEPLVVEDTLEDPRFADNPLVTGEPKLRFYAGCAIRTPDGQRVGTLCLLDSRPRVFSGEDRLQLRDLAAMVEAELSHGPPDAGGLGQRGGRLGIWLQRLPQVIRKRSHAMTVAAAIGVLLFAAVLAWDRSQVDAYRAEVHSNMLERLTVLRGRLETALNSKLHLTLGLRGFVRATRRADPEEFNTFAPQLGANVTAIRSLQLAPDGVVQLVWPLEGNRAAIGHDLLGDPARRAAAERAIEERTMWIAGPFELLQGGKALVARTPIFLPRGDGVEAFWGFATVLVDLPELLDEVELTASDGQFDYALRGKDGLGMAGEVFFGDPAVFGRQPTLQTVSLPAGQWIIAAARQPGLPQAYPWRGAFLAAGAAIVLMISTLIYGLLRLPLRLQQTIRTATAALERSDNRFRDAIEALPDGFVIFDRDDRLVLCNERYREVYAESRAMIQPGRRFGEITRYGMTQGQYRVEGGAAEIEAAIARRLAVHQRADSVLEQELGDGRWLRIVERRMRDGGTVGFRVDISELKRTELELREAIERAEQANQAKNSFLASISHEVRTPLNGVIGLLGLLREDTTLAEEQRHYAQTAYRSAQHLLSLLNEILDISKMEAGKLELESLPFNPSRLASDVLDLTGTQARAKGLELEAEIDPALDTQVLGDAGRLRQVLLNLVNNAIKFTDQGRIRVRLRGQAQPDERLRLAVEVQDTGIGFNQQQAARLFEAFAQADTEVAQRRGGTGLGLSISQHLVNMMGGTIVAQGRPGQGATFGFEIDLPRAAKPVATERASGAEAATAEPLLQTLRILLAEDSPTNQMVLKAMLAGTPCRIETVGNGADAVAAVRAGDFDIVLMDVQMPVMDGVEASRQIRALLPDSASTAIIALTANAMKGDRERFLAAGMDDYLPKPIDKALLLERLAYWSQRLARKRAAG